MEQKITISNAALARIFRSMADIYFFIGPDERFRALAYQKAARTIAGLPENITHYVKNGHFEHFSGIGESIEEKIIEYINTGTIHKYEELKETVPHELLDLMDVKGMGPQTLKLLFTQLGLKTKDEMVEALNNGTVSSLKGFGQKKIDNIKRALKLFEKEGGRMLLWDALEIGNYYLKELKGLRGVNKIELAGSLRRRKDTIGDIDILIAAKEKRWAKIIDHFTRMKGIKQVLVKGPTKASVLIENGNRQIDIRIVHPDEWGAALLYFTGSKEHCVHLRTIAKSRGLKINEYGVYNVDNNKRIAGNTEEDVYKTLGFDWIPPEMREEKGELELAKKGKIPRLITPEDIKGDMQMHTNMSDGMATLEETARYVKKNFNYEYIVITDHTASLRIAGGMNEEGFLRQIEAIKELNKKLGKDFVKAGVEVDIKADGSLDLSDDVLARFDWVTASIHLSPTKDITERLIKACQNKYVNCIGHPTGRIIGQREEYPVNWEDVFKTAAKTGTALEINAQPNRLDLNGELAYTATKLGAKLVISTDSHSLKNFDFMPLGVYMARRAWCTKENILNTRGWAEIQEFVNQKRGL